MFKVSFKEDSKKVQVFNNKVTKVTLEGLWVLFPKCFDAIPHEIDTWIWSHPSVEAHWYKGDISLTVSGKTVCSDEDTFDPIIGERIAEARAKIKLYRFMFTLCDMLIKYYLRLIYGNAKIQIFISKDSTISCISDAWNKYRELVTKESRNLDEMLLLTEEA